MEIKEQKQITIGKLEGDLYVAGDKVFKSFRSMVDHIAEQLGVPRKPRKPKPEPEPKVAGKPPGSKRK
jgi:hypothetical protein